MIAEIGHYALVLALALALVQSTLPLWGARTRRRRADAHRAGDRGVPAPVRRASPSRRWSTPMWSRTSPSGTSSRTPIRRSRCSTRSPASGGTTRARCSSGSPILALFGALVAVLGSNVPLTLRATVLAVQGWISVGLPPLRADHVEPLRARRSGAARGRRPQPGPPGHRPRHPPAAPLSRLCRLLDHLRLRGRRADRGAHRRRLGALGAAVDPRRLDLPDARHRDGLLLGLLRARLGRLVVLGSGRERLA